MAKQTFVEGLERYPTDGDTKNDFVTISKIIVPTERDKEQLLKALKYIHDSRCIDTEYYAVNTLTHIYNIPHLIEVQKYYEHS